MKKVTITLSLLFALLMSVQLVGQNLSEGFEVWPPADWIIVQGPCSPTNDITQSSDQSYTGTYSARMSSFSSCGSGYDQYMITPELNVTAGDQALSFWYRKYSSGSEVFMVGWSTTGTDVNTDFTWGTEITDASTTWQQYEKTDLPVGIKYVAVHYSSDWAYYLYLDDFAGPALVIPSCLKPIALTATNITSNSALLGWTESGAATSWNIEVDETGFTPTGTPTANVDDNPSYLLTGLSSGKSYDFYVQADCGEGEVSTWAGPVTFTTVCEAVSVFPYSENFDGNWMGIPAAPECWKVVNADEDSYMWSQSAQYLLPAHSAPYAAHGMGNGDDWLITPQIDLSGIKAEIKWWDKVESSTKINSYSVLVSTTDSDIASFTDELADIDCSNISWLEHTLNLSAYDGETIYIAFYQYYSASTVYGFGIDDFSISEMPACPPPSDLTATDITTSSALLGWTENGTATSWNIEFGASGFSPTGNPTASVNDDPTYLLTGLTSGASYAYYVRADCGDEYSDWTGPLTFITKVVAPVPYFEGFVTTTIPAGWLTTGWTIGSGWGAAGNPGNSIYKNLYSSTPGIFTTANIGTIEDGMLLTFEYKTSKYSSPFAPPAAGSGNFVVSISTDYGTTYTDIDTQPNDGIEGWHSKSYDLAIYAGFDVKIQITGNRFSEDYDLAFDNFKVEVPPACMPPSALTATDITTNSAMLGWTENGTAESWNIELGEAGFTPTGIPTYSGVTNPYLVEGLMDYTAYAFYVQADCGAKALSTWVGPFTFTTVKLPYTVPFFDGFEAGNTHNLAVAGWTQQAVTGSGAWTANNTLTTYNRTPKTGGWNAFLQYGNERWMFISVELTGGVKYAFSMYARQDESSGATIAVSYGDAGNAAAMVNPIIAETNIVNGDYQQLSGLFTPVADGIYFVGIKGQLNYTPWYLSIDDISIEVAFPGYITGVVTDAVTNDPLEGVIVTATPDGIIDITDALGNYSLELDVGTYELTFELQDYYQTTISGVLVERNETTFQNATLAPITPPDCAELVFPLDNQISVLLDEPLQWELPEGSAPATGYRLFLQNRDDEIWLEEDTDIGNVSEFLPVGGWEWGKTYDWLIFPYNNAGASEDCIPWSFTTSFTGIFEGMVTEAGTGLPLEGVRITLVEVLPHNLPPVEVMTAADGSWSFEFESGVYNLTYEKYGYETLWTPYKDLPASGTLYLEEELVPEVPYQMPFTETWSMGSYGAQKWVRDPMPGNWGLVVVDNSDTVAIFNGEEPNVVEDYDMLLKSYFIDATNETEVYVQFDLMLNNWDWDYFETMQFEVFNGTGRHVVEVFDNYWGNIPWQTNTYDISEYAAGGLFQIGFRAVGEDSYAIYYWLIDNIIVTNKLFEVQPETIHSVLNTGETADWDINIQNYGLGGIGWNAQIVPANAAMSLSETSGTVMPGTQTIILTLEADAVAPGIYDAEVIITGGGEIFIESVLVHFEVSRQEIMIPESGQWGYISTFIDMNGKMGMDSVMAPIKDDMVIMLGKTGIFWPEFDINTIGEYDTYQGYKLKMADDAALYFYGYPVENKTVSFSADTYIVPVLSEEPILAATVFDGNHVDFAFGLEGTIYWPFGNIYTLEWLEPGYGYLVRFNAPATLDFNGLKSGVEASSNKPASRENYTTWNDVNYTGDVHIIGISTKAVSELLPGDVVGVFSADGQCTGMALYNGDNKAFALVAYADDPTTNALDGMLEGEALQVKIFRDSETIDMQPVYNQSMPDHSGYYVINGLTMIDSFKTGATSIDDVATSSFAVYPNPTTGIITIDGINSTTRVMVTNTQGQIISNISIENTHQLDLSAQPSGLYFVKLVSDQGTKIVKLIVR